MAWASAQGCIASQAAHQLDAEIAEGADQRIVGIGSFGEQADRPRKQRANERERSSGDLVPGPELSRSAAFPGSMEADPEGQGNAGPPAGTDDDAQHDPVVAPDVAWARTAEVIEVGEPVP